MTLKHEKIKVTQEKYYSDLYEKHGPDVHAVASDKKIYKNLRYNKLCNLFNDDKSFSLHDIGFGLGHLYEYIQSDYPDKIIEYSGSEVTKHFADHCQKKYPHFSFHYRDIAEKSYQDQYDYLIFSGTFYHLANASQTQFQSFVHSILINAFQMCKKS